MLKKICSECTKKTMSVEYLNNNCGMSNTPFTRNKNIKFAI